MESSEHQFAQARASLVLKATNDTKSQEHLQNNSAMLMRRTIPTITHQGNSEGASKDILLQNTTHTLSAMTAEPATT